MRPFTVLLALVLPVILIGALASTTLSTSPAARAEGLSIVSLDSTLHIQWQATGDPNAAWQMIVIKEMDGTIQQSKVVGKTATVAQANGLIPGRSYNVEVYSVDGSGNLSLLGQATAATDPQSPMGNAAFFENFNDDPGPLLSDYFDVRTEESVNDPVINGPDTIQKRLVLGNENHFHTQLIGTTGKLEISIRPRVPLDISGGRTATIEFEVDMPPAQRGHGKWFSLMFSRNVPYSSSLFGDNTDSGYPDSVGFLMRTEDDGAQANGLNKGRIVSNVAGVENVVDGNTPHFTSANVRLPVVVKLSQTHGELWVNGDLAVATDFSPPLNFTTGYLTLNHRSYYSQRWFNNYLRAPTMVDQLVHWDVFQFNGPAGSYNPVVHTYIQPGCSGVADIVDSYIEDCPSISLGSYPFTFNITDDVSTVRSANLLFNGGSESTVTANVNGLGSFQVTNTGGVYDSLSLHAIDPAWLVQGQNTITLTSNNAHVAQVEVEAIFNQQRVMPAAHVHEAPMLSDTTNNIRLDRVSSDPNVMTKTTFVYSLGSDVPQPYTVEVLSDSPWLTVSPTSGTLRSPATVGQIVPINMRVDFGVLGATDDDGQTAIIRITNGLPNTMPAYVGLMVTNTGAATAPGFITTYPTFITNFNKDAIPDYHGGGGGTPTLVPTNTPIGQPTSTPTRTPTGGATGVPTNTPTRTPTGQPTNVPSNTPTGGPTGQPTNTPTRTPTGGPTGVPTDTPTEAPTLTPWPTLCAITFTDVPRDYWAWNYITYMACNNIVTGYPDGTFRPNNTVTRGQTAKIVALSAGFDDDPGGQIYDDVPVGSTFYTWVNQLSLRDIISGYPCGGPGEPCHAGNLPYFRPGDSTSRGQISKIVAIAAGFDGTPSGQTFQDVPPDSTFYLWVERLVSRDVMSGYPCGSVADAPCVPPLNLPYFFPGKSATRAQVCKIVANAMFAP